MKKLLVLLLFVVVNFALADSWWNADPKFDIEKNPYIENNNIYNALSQLDSVIEINGETGKVNSISDYTYDNDDNLEVIRRTFFGNDYKAYTETFYKDNKILKINDYKSFTDSTDIMYKIYETVYTYDSDQKETIKFTQWNPTGSIRTERTTIKFYEYDSKGRIALKKINHNFAPNDTAVLTYKYDDGNTTLYFKHSYNIEFYSYYPTKYDCNIYDSLRIITTTNGEFRIIYYENNLVKGYIQKNYYGGNTRGYVEFDDLGNIKNVYQINEYSNITKIKSYADTIINTEDVITLKKDEFISCDNISVPLNSQVWFTSEALSKWSINDINIKDSYDYYVDVVFDSVGTYIIKSKTNFTDSVTVVVFDNKLPISKHNNLTRKQIDIKSLINNNAVEGNIFNLNGRLIRKVEKGQNYRDVVKLLPRGSYVINYIHGRKSFSMKHIVF